MKYELLERNRLLSLIPENGVDCCLIGRISQKMGCKPVTIIKDGKNEVLNLTFNIEVFLIKYTES